jgi:hypothetical protein
MVSESGGICFSQTQKISSASTLKY